MFARRGLFLALAMAVAGTVWAVEWNILDPPARCAMKMLVDGLNQRAIMFGGTSVYADERYFDDAWEMPLGNAGPRHWGIMSPSGSPPQGRADHAFIYDPVGQRAIVFGGSPEFGTSVNDVWALNLETGHEAWQELQPSGTKPAARGYPFYIYEPVRHSLIIFGGSNWGPLYNDVWELKLDSMVWRAIAVSGQKPSPRRDGAAVYDAAYERMVIFGGQDANGFLDEVWSLDLTPGSEHWTELSPSGSTPDVRSGFAYAYDPASRKLGVFAGWNASAYLNDLYALDLADMKWQQITPSGPLPEARRNTCGTWDPVGDNFLVFGGERGSGVYDGATMYVSRGAAGVAEQPSWQTGRTVPMLHIPTVNRGIVRIMCETPLAGHVTIDILDLDGRVVRSLFSGIAAFDCLVWDAKSTSGRLVAPGTYYCRLETGASTVTRKFVLVK